MNLVEVSVEGVGRPDWLEDVRLLALEALGRLGKDGWDLSLLLCDDSIIRGLNRRYRGKDEPTDVLSFEQGGTYRDSEGGERFLAGDIAVSLECLSRNAAEFGVPVEQELARLILHGILHLAGMDHEDADPARPMLALQEETLRALPPLRPFAKGGAR